MFQKTEKRFGPGLRRIVEIHDDMIVNRPVRRAISGVAYNAQRSYLVPDEPDAEGNKSYFCKIADTSVGGFGVACRAASTHPELFKSGTQMTLEGMDGKRVRVQIRWVKNGRLGLRLVQPAAG
jgi:hypothetical protein